MLHLYGFSSTRDVAEYYGGLLPQLILREGAPEAPPMWTASPLPSANPQAAFLSRLAKVWKNYKMLPATEQALREMRQPGQSLPGEELLETFLDREEVVARYTLGPVYLHRVRLVLGSKPSLHAVVAASGLPLSLNIFQLMAALCYLFGEERAARMLDEDLYMTAQPQAMYRVNASDFALLLNQQPMDERTKALLFGCSARPSFLFPLPLENENSTLGVYHQLATRRNFAMHIVSKGWYGVTAHWPLDDAYESVKALAALQGMCDAEQFEALVDVAAVELRNADTLQFRVAAALTLLVQYLKSDVVRLNGLTLEAGETHGLVDGLDTGLWAQVTRGALAEGEPFELNSRDSLELRRTLLSTVDETTC